MSLLLCQEMATLGPGSPWAPLENAEKAIPEASPSSACGRRETGLRPHSKTPPGPHCTHLVPAKMTREGSLYLAPGPLQTPACFIFVLYQGSATSGQLRSDFWFVLVDSWQGCVPRFYPWGLETGQETPVSLQVGTPGMGQPALMPGTLSHICAWVWGTSPVPAVAPHTSWG